VALVAVAGSTACRKEAIALDGGGGGGPSTVQVSGAVGGESRALGKDRSEAASQERFVVRMERTVCYGLCPAYAVVIGADGAVDYEGKSFVSVRGHARSHVSPAAASALESRFEQAGFFRVVGTARWVACDAGYCER
jgi:hypothetical protein